MEPNTNVRLCEAATTLDESWRKIYAASFPDENEREPEDRLVKLINAGKLLYHTTLCDNELVCFTLVSLAQDFSMLAYMATDSTKRSGGWGSKHLKRLLELLKQQYPTHVGMFLEIASTEPTTVTISDEEKKTRTRRLTFYEKCGARVVCDEGVYLTPSRAHPGKEWEGELLCVEFGERISQETLRRIIPEIYQLFYCMSPDDPLIAKVLNSFKNCDGHTPAADCQTKPTAGTTSGATADVTHSVDAGQSPAPISPAAPADKQDAPALPPAVTAPQPPPDLKQSDCQVVGDPARSSSLKAAAPSESSSTPAAPQPSGN